MSEKPKIKILDSPELRDELVQLTKQATQIQLANWAMNCAKHILDLSPTKINMDIVNLGFQTNLLWQNQNATVHEVRQVGFKIHKEVGNADNEITNHILRTVGQTVAVGHMQEHAMVCSDYAIKTVQLHSKNNIEIITLERQWQINELKIMLNREI